MHKPTTETKVLAAKPHDIVTLWRGTIEDTAKRIEKHMTADGYDTSATPGIDPGNPTEKEAITQVLGMSALKPRTLPKFPEYTTSEAIAKQFAAGAIVCIAIQRKYLTKGSVSENGWVAYHEAPIRGVAWIKHTSVMAGGMINSATGRRIFAD